MGGVKMRLLDQIASTITGIRVQRDPSTGQLLSETYSGPIGSLWIDIQGVQESQDYYDLVMIQNEDNEAAFEALIGQPWGEVVVDKRGHRSVVLHFVNSLDDVQVARELIGVFLSARNVRERAFDLI